jgi:multidrug efflux pump subunit AcrA (membrane-fusion protein)
MVARVTITPSQSEDLSFLPTQSLIETAGQDAAVFVVTEGRARRQPVRVVRIGVESIGVAAPGLEGATVVTDGAAYLREGDRVEDRTSDLPAL